MKAKELIDQRLKLVADGRSLWAKIDGEKRRPTAEEKETLRKLDGDVASLAAQIEAEAAAVTEEQELRQSLEAQERALGESRGRKTATLPSDAHSDNPSRYDEDLAFRAWMLGRQCNDGHLRAAAQRCGVDIYAPHIDMAERRTWGTDGREVRSWVPVRTKGMGDFEARALSEGTTTAGGNAVQNELMQRYQEIQKWYGRLADRATQLNTETGATLPYPTVDDTANTGEQHSEGGTATTTNDGTYSVVNLSAYVISSQAALVSWELIQDAYINIPNLLGTQLGRRIARFKNTKFTKGAGTTEPKGLITGATTSAAAATNAFTYDEVITLIHAVDIAYRGLPDTGFMMHDTIAAYLRKFKDGQGRYMWEPSTQLGQPDRFFGYMVDINNDMDSALTTAKKLVGFGNIPTAFVTRSAGAVRFVRDESIFVRQHQIYFEASERWDSNVVDTTAFKVLTLA